MSANLPKQWLERAVEDLVVAQLLLNEEHFSHACFLSQQSMEKAPKALLFHVTGAYPRTHRWVDLPGKVEAREAVEIAERLLTAITPKLPQENEREKTDSEEKVDDE